jgi:hypothetical protein
MIEVLDNWHKEPIINEDMYFASYPALHKPPHHDAKNFSVECIYHNQSFGIHQCWRYMSDEQMQVIALHIPHIFELKDMYYRYKSENNRTYIINISEIF